MDNTADPINASNNDIEMQKVGNRPRKPAVPANPEPESVELETQECRLSECCIKRRTIHRMQNQ